MSLIRGWMNPEGLYVFESEGYYEFSYGRELPDTIFRIPVEDFYSLCRMIKLYDQPLPEADDPSDFLAWMSLTLTNRMTAPNGMEEVVLHRIEGNRRSMVAMSLVTWYYIFNQCLEQNNA